MKLNTLREAFTIGRKYADGELTYHGKAGFFKLYTPAKHDWGNEEELRLLSILTDEATKATNAIRKLGFKRQVHNIAIIDTQRMGRNKHSAKSYNAGLASDKGHGMLISRNAVRPVEAMRVLVHEWAHKYWYQLTPTEKAKVTSVYDQLIVDPLAEKDAKTRVERKMSEEWRNSSELIVPMSLPISKIWLDMDPKTFLKTHDDMAAYLEGIKSGFEIEGTIKKPLEHVLIADTGKEGTLSIGDLVLFERSGAMWKVHESREHGKVTSRYLSSKMVTEHIHFRPEANLFKAIQAMRSKGNIALLGFVPETTWKIIARNTIVGIISLVPREYLDPDSDRTASRLLEGGLEATIEAWWQSVKNPRGKGPQNLKDVYMALRKIVRNRLDWEPFLKYQRPITKNNMAKKSASVRRKSLEKRGDVHSAYGASNASEYWATLVEYGAMGKPLDKASEKLLKTLGR